YGRDLRPAHSRCSAGLGPGSRHTVALDRALETLQDGLPGKLVAVARIAGGLSATSLPAAIGALPAQGPTPDLVGEILRDRRRLCGPRHVLNRRTADHDLVALRERQRRL